MKRGHKVEGPEFYDSKYGRWFRRPKLTKPDRDRFRRLAREVSEHVVGSVLDLGCGLGFLAEVVPGPYLGVDFSPFVIRKAKKQNRKPEVQFLEADIRDLPDVGEFDTVTMLEVLEHLDDPAQAVRTAKELARRKIVVSVPRHQPGKGHVWPTWSRADLESLLGSGTVCWRYRGWRLAMWEKYEKQA